MGHERYHSPPGELLQRPVDELARRLFAAGGVEGVHINGSVITVTLRGGQRGEGLADVVRHLFLHYRDTPTDTVAAPLDDADATPEALADPADAPSAQASADEAPAPERPAPEESAAEQEIPGIPNAEVEPQAAPPVEREPSAADPEEVAAAEVANAAPSPASGGAIEVTDDVAPTPDVERPVAEPLTADDTDDLGS
jgi:hypothetical protein